MNTTTGLGYADYSEYFIGHSGSTYWRKKDSEKAEIFSKIEPYLTFLNMQQLGRRGADIPSQVEELEQLNQSMIDRDKVKMTLVTLSTRSQEIERRQVLASERGSSSYQYITNIYFNPTRTDKSTTN